MKIAVVGSGYVGMSLSVLLAQYNQVVVYDIDEDRVKLINKKKSTIFDKDIDYFLAKKNLKLSATLDKFNAYEDAEFIIIAAPTNFSQEDNYFDTSTIDYIIEDIRNINKEATIIIKSTVPIGYTLTMQKKFDTDKILFSPEFLREGKALEDNLNPSRIIIGTTKDIGITFANLLKDAATKKNIEILYMGSTEAEAVKLFSNSYLAMRVSFFNELDSFAMNKKLKTEDIINGVCLDSRIGEGYNNPSFGYGGYCLPKDTKQLLSNFNTIPQSLIGSIITSNSIRKDFITNEIIKKKPKVVGIYRLIMKSESDNQRSSAIQGIIKRLSLMKIDIIIYEPNIKLDLFDGHKIYKNFEDFKNMSDLIVCNRKDKQIKDVKDKIFTRDFFRRD